MQGHVHSPVCGHMHEFSSCLAGQVMSHCCLHDHLKNRVNKHFLSFLENCKELQSCQECVYVEIIPVKSSPKREDWDAQILFLCLVL